MAYSGYFLTQSSLPRTDVTQLLQSGLASDRIRGSVACSTPSVGWFCGTPPNKSDKWNYLLVGKPPPNGEALESWSKCVQQSIESRASVIVDYTDHHLVRSVGLPIYDFYKNVLSQADAVSVPTETLKSYLIDYGLTGSKVHVIPDVIEQSLRPPKTSLAHPGTSVGLWFGHPSNISYLRQYLAGVGQRAKEWRLILVTSEAFLQTSNLRPGAWVKLSEGPLIFPHPWGIRAVEEAAELCDYALLPGDPLDSGKNGASPNRLLSALSLGLPTITSGLKSHLPFSRYWVDQENVRETDRLIQEPFLWAESVRGFQDTIAPHFNPSVVRTKWQELFDLLKP